MGEAHNPEDPRLVAVVDLIGRSGASEFSFRYSDDEEPTIWMATAKWPKGREAAGALTPLAAGMRLLEAILDGVGTCAHCGKTTGVSDDWEHEMPLNELVCWYVYDPETERFRRSCEGETTGRKFTMDREGNTVGRNDPCPCGSGEKFKRWISFIFHNLF